MTQKGYAPRLGDSVADLQSIYDRMDGVEDSNLYPPGREPDQPKLVGFASQRPGMRSTYTITPIGSIRATGNENRSLSPNHFQSFAISS